ncbi:TonB-dependent receptor-like protein [Novosphingobium resinovorum]|uniref:TonB-dependent receptor-like protein n=2 Tax=Novosphingobium resinovorum TaxID=158500 RepID=A0A031J6Z7_9SPHN|nr:TonB-dependent receptor-like protein [Novosphingobium resinovorum]
MFSAPGRSQMECWTVRLGAGAGRNLCSGRENPSRQIESTHFGVRTMRISIIRGSSAAALAATFAIASPAFAQHAPRDAESEESRNDIIVTGQQAQKQVVSDGNIGVLGNKDALSTPFNITSYTAQLILDQQSETIGDVLENDPSVRTTYGSGNQSELFVIRGFALNGDDVSIDGLYGVTPRQLVSPELYESVQVLNGASAFLFGAAPGGSGIGGGINLVPKRAQKTLIRGTASYSADGILGGNVDIGTRFGPDREFGIRVNGVYRSGDTAVDNEHREVKVAGASFDFRKGPGRFFLDFGYEEQAANYSRPTVRLANNIAVPRTPDANDNYGQPWTFTKLRDIYALARVEIDIAKDWMVYLAAGMRDGSEKGDYSTLTITNAATGAGTGSRLYVPREDNNESGQFGLRGKFAVSGITNEINFGGSATYTENRNAFAFGAFPAAVRTACGASATSFCTNLYNAPIVDRPPNSVTPGLVSGSFTDLPRVSTGAFTSLFASDTIGFLGDRILVTVGARRQNMIVNAYNRTTLARTSRYDESRTTPVVGVIVKPAGTVSLYANRIEGLAQGPTAPLTNVTNPGEVFAPYKSVQYELGGKMAIHGLTGTVALYQTKQPSTFTTTPASGLGTFVVDGEQRNRGVEVTLNGEPADWLRFIGGFSVNDAKITKSLNGVNNGKKAIGVPDYQVNFGTEVVPSFIEALTLTGRVVLTGKQMINIPSAAAAAQELPDWVRFDLGARYVAVIGEHPVTFRMSAENIANRRYWSSAFGGYLLQGSPRTVKASMTFEY